MQLIAQHFGGRVVPADHHEYGKAKLQIIDQNSPIFRDIPDNSVVWMSHGDRVETVPEGLKLSPKVITPLMLLLRMRIREFMLFSFIQRFIILNMEQKC